MSTIEMASLPKVTNPVLLRLADSAQKDMELSICQALFAVLNPAKSKYRASAENESHEIGDLVAAQFKKLPSEQQIAVAKGLGILQTGFSSEIRSLAAMRGVDLLSKEPVANQVKVETVYSFVNAQTMTKSVFDAQLQLRPTVEFSPHHIIPADLVATSTTPRKARELRFNLHEVKCIDETGGPVAEGLSHDKIQLHGQTTNDRGKLNKIDAFRVSNSFDDGDIVRFDPVKVLRKFPLDDDYTPPKKFSVNLFMTEIDNNAVGNLIRDLFRAVQSRLESILRNLGRRAGEYIASELGAGDGTVSSTMGDVLGSLAVRILRRFVSWLVGLFGDDVFRPEEEHWPVMFLYTPTATFNGSLRSPLKTMTFEDHRGKYTLKYSWELVR